MFDKLKIKQHNVVIVGPETSKRTQP